MPYSFAEVDGLIRVTLQGRVPSAELHDTITELEQMVSGRIDWPDQLIDLRSVDLSSLGFTDILSIAKRRESVMPPNPIRTALVADSPIVTGFARMFQSVNHNPSITIEVFSTIETAEAWLTGR